MNLPATHSTSDRRRRRRGFTFLEVIVATAMLAVLLAMVGQLIVLTKRHAVAAEQQTIALRAVENCLEQITNLPWEEINDASIASLKLSEDVHERWPQAKFTGAVTSSAEPVAAKQISLELSLSPAGRTPSARLTTWVYRRPNQ